jgi:hypothetical protein
VYVPPLDGSHAFDEARAAFSDIGIRAVPEDSADEIGASATNRLDVAVS